MATAHNTYRLVGKYSHSTFTQMETKDILDGLKTIGENVDSYKKEAAENKKEIASLKSVNQEFATAIDSLKKDRNNILRTGAFDSGVTPEIQLKSVIKDLLVKSDLKSILNKNLGSRELEYESKGMTISSTGASTTFQTGYGGQPQRSYYKFHFRDILPFIANETGNFMYLQEQASIGTGSFGKSTETQTKAALTYNWLAVQLTLRYMAGTVLLSREVVQDVPVLMDYLQNSLYEDFCRAEDQDVYNQLISSGAALVTSGANSGEKILDAVAQLLAAGRNPTAIIASISAWTSILKTKPNDYSTPGGIFYDALGNLLIAGIPVYPSPVLLGTSILAGDFNNAAKMVFSESFNIRFCEYDGSNFSSNQVSCRAESRENLMILAPKAFVFGSV